MENAVTLTDDRSSVFGQNEDIQMKTKEVFRFLFQPISAATSSIMFYSIMFDGGWVLLDSRPRWTVQSRHEACMFRPHRHAYTEQHRLRAPRSPLKAPYRPRRCVMRPPGRRVDTGHRHPVTLTHITHLRLPRRLV